MTRNAKILSLLLSVAGITLLYGCHPSANVPEQVFEDSGQGKVGINEHMIVDCLLPGQLRRLGNRVFLSPRKPKKLSAGECTIKGGEYIVYDRANIKTALKAWQVKANKDNDPEAQTYVGEIYEKGFGMAPNYELAAQWYRKAAERGFTRAQINLGHLFELGLGVPKDRIEAIRWYRLGAGLSETLALQGFAADTSESKEIERLRKEIERLQEQLRKARETLRNTPNRRGETGRSDPIIQSLQNQLNDLIAKQAGVGRVRIPKIPSMDKGDYHALIIGNNNYVDKRNFPTLKTAINDARKLKQILIRRYRFGQDSVKLLVDAKYKEIYDAFAWFKQKLGSQDKFLIYFAGHGTYDELNDIGYWLPVDAENEVQAFWISNEQITRQINGIQARHILVIADSCYSGTMTDLAILRPRSGLPDSEIQYMVKTLVEKPSRTVLTSGSLTPVISSGQDKHSLFAEVLLQILESNKDIIAGKDLYNEVFPRVASTSQLLGMKQEPDYGALRGAGHRAGDFLFVPQTTMAGTDATLRPQRFERF